MTCASSHCHVLECCAHLLQQLRGHSCPQEVASAFPKFEAGVLVDAPRIDQIRDAVAFTNLIFTDVPRQCPTKLMALCVVSPSPSLIRATV